MMFVDLAPLSCSHCWKSHLDHDPVGWIAVGSRSCEETCTELGLSSSSLMGGREGVVESVQR